MKITLVAVAKALRKSEQYVSDLENGKRNWTSDLILAYLRMVLPKGWERHSND